MKLVLITILVIIVTACTEKTDSHSHDDHFIMNKELTQTQVESVINKWLKMWETNDLTMLSDIFLQSEHLTYFSSEKVGLIIGYDKMRPHHEGFGFVDGGKKAEKDLWLEELDYRFYDDMALVAGIWYFGDKSAEKDSVQRGPVTFVIMQDEQGKMKIVHTHFGNYK